MALPTPIAGTHEPQRSRLTLGFATLGTLIVVCGLYAAFPTTEGVADGSIATTRSGVSQTQMTSKQYNDDRKNVLVIYADDFRPQIAAMYPDTAGFMHTPGLDRLYEDSFTSTQYVPATAWCCPSRASTLTSRRPATTQVYEFQLFRDALPDVVTLPGHFRDAGYVTRGAGKFFHSGNRNPYTTDPMSWDDDVYIPETFDYYGGGGSWRTVGAEEAKNIPLPDALLVDWTIESLQELSESDEHFFLGVGFYKPHLPFVAEEKWFDLYSPDSYYVQPLQGAIRYVAEGFPEIAFSGSQELFSYDDFAVEGGWDETWNKTIDDAKAADLRRAYYACVSQTDSHVERILNTLDDLQLADDTIVLFMGDHGWHLGHHAMWDKQANTKTALNTPLLLRVPGLTDGGIHTRAHLEGVDIMPTLAELAGVPRVPRCPEDSLDSQATILCTEGQSFAPLVIDPERPWKSATFSQYQKMDLSAMGYSMMTEAYHAVVWVYFDYDTSQPDFTNMYAAELYDLETDPEENVNIAAREQSIFYSMYRDIQAKYASGEIVEVEAAYNVYGQHTA